jgi:hypothetical protein
MGSAVRERGHRRSDFDLLVIHRGKRPPIKPPVEVDIRFVSLERINDQISKGHEVVGWALKFGSAIYDPEGIWRNLQQSWGDHIPLPSAAQAGERGRQALARAAEMLDAEDESAADDLLLAALTQFVRERLIRSDIFPASRPELPDQLRDVDRNDPLARLLEKAMQEESSPRELMSELKAMHR